MDHGEDDALGAEVDGFAGPVRGGAVGDADYGGRFGGGEGVEAGEGVRDAAVPVLHVDEDEVVAGEAGDLGDGWGESKEGHAVDDLAVLDSGLEGRRGGVIGGVHVSGYGDVGGGAKRMNESDMGGGNLSLESLRPFTDT